MIRLSPDPGLHAPTLLRAVGVLTIWMTLGGLATSAERVVLLHNGNAFAGKVIEQERRVVVETKGRQVSFDPLDVDIIVANLTEAYQRKSSRISPRNTHSREKMLAWCIQNQLIPQARQQLAMLQQQHPNFPGLELWQRRIDSHGKLAGKTVLPSKTPLHPDAQVAKDSKTLMSKETQSQFVRTVQPILFNRCAQADCHGRASKNSFSLLAGRSPMPRTLSQRNLGATLRQIGDMAPEQSLLWMSAVEAHGGAKKNPLNREELEKVLGGFCLRIATRRVARIWLQMA